MVKDIHHHSSLNTSRKMTLNKTERSYVNRIEDSRNLSAMAWLQQLRGAERCFQRSLCLPDLVQVTVWSTEIRPRLLLVAKHISHERYAL